MALQKGAGRCRRRGQEGHVTPAAENGTLCRRAAGRAGAPGCPRSWGRGTDGLTLSLSEPAGGTGSANALMLGPSASSTTWQRVPVGGASSRPPWASDEPPDACVLTSAHFNSGYTPLLTLRFLSSCPGFKSCKWPRLIVLPILDAVGGQCPQTQSSA